MNEFLNSAVLGQRDTGRVHLSGVAEKLTGILFRVKD